MTTPDPTEARRLAAELEGSRVASREAPLLRSLADEVEQLRDHLQFVERWANHHGQKDSVSAESALSVIQHYPPIKAITKSYVDGKAPDTFDPWEELERLRAQVAQTDTERAAWKRWCEAGETEDGFLIRLREWAVRMWREEVQNRPPVNVHYARLDATWRTVMKRAGLEPDEIVGPVAAATPSLTVGERTQQTLTPRQLEVLEFLYGAGPLDGHWFEPDRKPKFWWRTVLREAFGDAAPQPAAQAEPVARMVETSVGADIFVHGVKVPTFPIGCAADAQRAEFVEAVNRAAASKLPAQGMGDERAAFEAVYLAECRRRGIGDALADHEFFRRDGDGAYSGHVQHHQWTGFQAGAKWARATLAQAQKEPQ